MAANDYPTVDALAPAATEAKAETVGAGKATMPLGRAFVLAILAGLFIGMGGMFMLLVKSDSSLSFAASSLLGGLSFSLGLFAVLVAGAELFTGNNLMVLGCLAGKYTLAQLIRSWCVVYVGNLVGSLILAAILLAANFAGMNGGAVGETAVAVATAKSTLPFATAFFRGVMCNILVCLAVWLGFAGKTVLDKFLAAAVPVTAFVACGFEHCVANMFFLPFGMALSGGSVVLGGVIMNIVAATLGNMVGGALIFAGAYWLAFGKKSA